MSASLKEQILNAIWKVAEEHAFILSTTVTGSFIDKPSLDGISDIDCVVIVDHLNEARFAALQLAFDDLLRPVLGQHSYDLRINATLGPLKFNEPKLAVLHLMLYSESTHVEHVLKSPFTCLDWQRSQSYRKRSLANVFPVLGLQPRHFTASRRGMMEYLKDLNSRSISYRELICTANGYSEQAKQLPMNERDRHEFAYHVLRFLMSNLLKLLDRTNTIYSGEDLLNRYFAVFPAKKDSFENAYLTLKNMKDKHDFSNTLENLDGLMRAFIDLFECQFRRLFVDTATRHLVFRHAPTHLNGGIGEETQFVGRLDPGLLETDDARWNRLAESVRESSFSHGFVSPTSRARQTYARLSRLQSLPLPIITEQLHEINYGEMEGHSIRTARIVFPHIFTAWNRGDDPRLPGGESVSDVHERVQQFVDEHWKTANGNTLVCTHNVVLRCLLGSTLGMPKAEWHRLRVPHLAPFTFIQTRTHGLFIDIEPECERQLLASYHPKLAE